MSKLLKALSPYHIIKRNLIKKKYNWPNEGISYPGFKYYPRYPNFQDPPYNPTKLFRVERIKNMKGSPYWEKDKLKEFGLDGKLHQPIIVKNIPENNQKLWKIKHLIRITPITFPDGFPKETDHTYLQENGELRIIKNVSELQQEQKLELLENFKNDTKKMDGDTLRRDSRQKWLIAWD